MAGDVKCPLCGSGFRDVAPTFEIGRYHPPDGIVPLMEAISGTCTNGHPLKVSAWYLGTTGQVSSVVVPA